jgi:hypothetical protein
VTRDNNDDNNKCWFVGWYSVNLMQPNMSKTFKQYLNTEIAVIMYKSTRTQKKRLQLHLKNLKFTAGKCGVP